MTDAAHVRPFDSLQVMAYIIQQCDGLDVDVNITKLQKLMYCCYGVCLSSGLRLCDESPEAWRYGPVFPRTLRVLQQRGIDFVRHLDAGEVSKNLPEGFAAKIVATLKTFGRFAANQLSNWSHQPGSPWYVASSGGFVLREQIRDDLIAEYFADHVLKKH